MLELAFVSQLLQGAERTAVVVDACQPELDEFVRDERQLAPVEREEWRWTSPAAGPACSLARDRVG
jgi:hypothetical protein